MQGTRLLLSPKMLLRHPRHSPENSQTPPDVTQTPHGHPWTIPDNLQTPQTLPRPKTIWVLTKAETQMKGTRLLLSPKMLPRHPRHCPENSQTSPDTTQTPHGHPWTIPDNLQTPQTLPRSKTIWVLTKAETQMKGTRLLLSPKMLPRHPRH
jgi:hypothetical protein